mmetsp:Transcript_93654/g.297176  ORF Transcript_93654/g.297176 Transcript_93654/m.297176 type:complete len:311 (+) Transcript_93654:850-1782(+)
MSNAIDCRSRRSMRGIRHTRRFRSGTTRDSQSWNRSLLASCPSMPGGASPGRGGAAGSRPCWLATLADHAARSWPCSPWSHAARSWPRWKATIPARKRPVAVSPAAQTRRTSSSNPRALQGRGPAPGPALKVWANSSGGPEVGPSARALDTPRAPGARAHRDRGASTPAEPVGRRSAADVALGLPARAPRRAARWRRNGASSQAPSAQRSERTPSSREPCRPTGSGRTHIVDAGGRRMRRRRSHWRIGTLMGMFGVAGPRRLRRLPLAPARRKPPGRPSSPRRILLLRSLPSVYQWESRAAPLRGGGGSS